MKTKKYNQKFYETLEQSTLKSARKIVPYLISIFHPKKVLDVGCGLGIWLKEFSKRNIDITGIEGKWILDKENLYIKKDRILVKDLSEGIFKMNNRFDLTICLEVAEHLPKESATRFINSLTNTSDVIVFSAAIPFQGGTNHLNEQYQSFWASLFKKRGFVPLNLIREKFWQDKEILSHYLQNTLIYVKKSKLDNISASAKLNFQLDIVHPREYEWFAIPCKRIKSLLPGFLLNLIRRFK